MEQLSEKTLCGGGDCTQCDLNMDGCPDAGASKGDRVDPEPSESGPDPTTE